LLVGRHRRELDVDLLGDGARLGDLGRDLRDPDDLVLGDDRAAGEAPDAAVDHADAEAGRLGAAAAAPATPAAAAPAAAPAATAAPPARGAAGRPRGPRRSRRDRLRPDCRRWR